MQHPAIYDLKKSTINFLWTASFDSAAQGLIRHFGLGLEVSFDWTSSMMVLSLIVVGLASAWPGLTSSA